MNKYLGNQIYSSNAAWSFGKKVPKSFIKHITKSIPFYLEGHKIICEISDFFLKEKSVCYDIGCSTGLLLNKISDRHKNKKIKFIGIDSEKSMINYAKKKYKTNKIKFLNNNIQKLSLKISDLIISYYTLQFINPKYRQAVISKIYKSLNWGGAFIIFEKIRASDARFQDIYSLIYSDFKLNNGITPSQIISKTRSLKGVLEPFSDFGNRGLIKRAGFVDYITIFQWMNFKGYLCIK